MPEAIRAYYARRPVDSLCASILDVRWQIMGGSGGFDLLSFLDVMDHLWVRRGFKMILSHRAPPNLKSILIWAHTEPHGPISDRTLYFVNKIYQILVTKSWFWVHDIILMGSCRPRTPCCSQRGFQTCCRQPTAPPPRFLWGSASQAPRFFGVPRSWYQDLGTKMQPTWNRDGTNMENKTKTGTKMKPKFKGWNPNGTNIQRLEPEWKEIYKTGSSMQPKHDPHKTIGPTWNKWHLHMTPNRVNRPIGPPREIGNILQFCIFQSMDKLASNGLRGGTKSFFL